MKYAFSSDCTTFSGSRFVVETEHYVGWSGDGHRIKNIQWWQREDGTLSWKMRQKCVGRCNKGNNRKKKDFFSVKISTFPLSLTSNNAFPSLRVKWVCTDSATFPDTDCIRAVNFWWYCFPILAITGSASGLSYYNCEKTHP